MKKDANKRKLETLIESLVVKVLEEEYDIVTQDPLIKVFISPFTDVIKTAKGEIEKNLAIGYSTIKNLAKQAAVLAIPIFASSMIKDIQEKSDEELQERLGKINERYAEVLKRNWDTVRGRDVWGITFMLDPTFGIAEKFIARAPYAALGTLEALTGGNPKVTELKEKAAKLVHHVTPEYFASFGGGVGSGGGGGFGGWGGGYGAWGDFGGDFGGFGDGGGFGGGESVQSDKPVMSEQQAQQQQQTQQQQKQQTQQQQKQLTPQQKQQLAQVNKQIADAVMQLKNDPSVQKSIQSSPVAQQLQAGAFESIMDVVKPVMAASTYEQLKSAIGPEFKKFEQDLLKDLPEEMKAPDKLKELQQSLVPELKQAYKSVLLKQLQGLVKKHPNIAKPMNNLIQQINKM